MQPTFTITNLQGKSLAELQGLYTALQQSLRGHDPTSAEYRQVVSSLNLISAAIQAKRLSTPSLI